MDLPVSASTFLSVSGGFIALVSGLENCRTQKSQFLSMSRHQKRQGHTLELKLPETCADLHSESGNKHFHAEVKEISELLFNTAVQKK